MKNSGKGGYRESPIAEGSASGWELRKQACGRPSAGRGGEGAPGPGSAKTRPGTARRAGAPPRGRGGGGSGTGPGRRPPHCSALRCGPAGASFPREGVLQPRPPPALASPSSRARAGPRLVGSGPAWRVLRPASTGEIFPRRKETLQRAAKLEEAGPGCNSHI